jgi:Thiol-disulfide isomerase and thioredoxins
MKNKNFKKNITVLLITLGTLHLFGQNIPLTLKMGDQAPELKVNWIKGTPITNYDNDKLYIVEFWATWCGPCKAAMPHLSELAKQYTDKVVFIGVNIWEDSHGERKENYDDLIPSVKDFVKGMGDKMAYNIAMDNNTRFMADHWMKASGQNGIPSTFLIKEGKIIWIGHPMKLDNILEEVFAGNYSIEEGRKELKKEEDIKAQQGAIMNALFKPVSNALAAKDYSRAQYILDSAEAAGYPYKPIIYDLRFETLLAYDVPKALVFAKETKREITYSYDIAKREGLSKETYLFAIEVLTQSLSDQRSVKPDVYHHIASCYFKMQDIPNAIAFEKKAIEIGSKAVKENKYPGIVNNSTIKGYEETLAKYKAANK